jgi:tRNA threonylcarbamoyl adenosine modification protein (Sua5/YciO/YrdC/YwlC family)
MLLKLHAQNPAPRALKTILACLRGGGVIIYPTDTVYGMGCDIFQPKAIERICLIKGVDPLKAQFSFICSDLSQLSDYTRSIDTPLFRLLNRSLPGPFTFILPASKAVPKLLKAKKNTVGIRVPDNNICKTILTELEHPIMSSSLPGNAPIAEYTDPEVIHEKFGHLVDIVIDGGIGGAVPSTVVDCTTDRPVIVREGAGHLVGVVIQEW